MIAFIAMQLRDFDQRGERGERVDHGCMRMQTKRAVETERIFPNSFGGIIKGIHNMDGEDRDAAFLIQTIDPMRRAGVAQGEGEDHQIADPGIAAGARVGPGAAIRQGR